MPARLPIFLCIDRVVPNHLKVSAAALSVKENTANEPSVKLLAGVSAHPLQVALLTGKKWANGRTLGVKFLDGSLKQKKKAQQYAEMWEAYANIHFDFSAKGEANTHLRISFQADLGSWSAIGTDCLLADYFPRDEPTMNFGWLAQDSDDVEWRRVVLHQFGHVLSAIHEHQNPAGRRGWNLPAVYSYFGGPPNNWTKGDIELNVIQKYSISQHNGTTFDPRSIMLYAFPPELTLDRHQIVMNTELSAGDKNFIAKMYPTRT